MRFFSKSPVFVILIIVIGGCYPIAANSLNQQQVSCGLGTTLIDDQCTITTQLNDIKIVEIKVDFVYDEIIVNEGDYVRLTFIKDSDQHYLANSFEILELNISMLFGAKDEATIDFFAYPAGTYQYGSGGVCQVNIPGAGYVIVDCSIFCGETKNSESGTLIIKSKSPVDQSLQVSNLGSKVCSILPNYCNENHSH